MTNEAEQVALLEGLLHQYSPTGQEGPAVAYLVEQMAALGLQTQVDGAGNAVGWRGEGPREVLLLGHIDTVPGQLTVRREGDSLWGRGSVDAKGPLAAFTCAAGQAQPPKGWKLTVIGAVGEEGSSPGAKFARDQRASQPPEMVVIGEPSRWDKLTLGYKGSAWFEYRVQADLAHTAGQAESASETAVAFWNGLQEKRARFNEGRERAFEQLTASLRGMNSGEDGFSTWASLRFNLRLPPDLTPRGAQEMLSGLAGAGQLTLLDGLDCYRAEKNTALVRAFLAAIRAEGGKPGFLVKTGTSDMNVVGPGWNAPPMLAYGPGDSNLDHTPVEHVEVSEYLQAVRVLVKALEGMMRA